MWIHLVFQWMALMFISKTTAWIAMKFGHYRLQGKNPTLVASGTLNPTVDMLTLTSALVLYPNDFCEPLTNEIQSEINPTAGWISAGIRPGLCGLC